MKREIQVTLYTQFEEIVQTETETGTEFWMARDIQEVLGYQRWENFQKVIEKAKTSCETSGYKVRDHFLDVTKMVTIGSGAEREIDDIALMTASEVML